ncbi:helicase-related protein [Deferrisoma palaeochoriense]
MHQLGGSPGDMDGTAWRRSRVDDLLGRVRAAEAPADRGALIREAVRLSGAPLQLPLGLVGGVEPERFGLVLEPGSGKTVQVRLTGALPPELPGPLREELARVLPVDDSLRRPDRPTIADTPLLRLTPHPTYRNPSQKAAVRALLTMPGGATLLATLATGTGKSLLFQLGTLWARSRAMAEEKPVGLVVVPTVSLALDHERSAQDFPGLESSRALTGDLPPAERDDILAGFFRGETPLLFATAEILLGRLREWFLRCTLPPDHPDRPLAARGRLWAVFVDEAHTVASWGTSFRPDLQRLGAFVRFLRKSDPALRAVLLSATVDHESRRVLKQQFADGDWLEIREGVPRREFDLVDFKFQDPESRDVALSRLLDALPRPCVVYTTEVDHAERLAELFRGRGYRRLAVFTGDTPAPDRRSIVEAWRGGALDLVVATSAFGMGVNHAHVRCVVHACVPESASRYYQEIGRAGRDGRQALAVLLRCPEDARLARRLASGRTLTLDVAAKRWVALLRARRFGEVSPWTGQPAYLLPLDARGEQIQHAVTGERNRFWNRSLLVQLQRYGAVEVLVADDQRDEWHVASVPGWDALWDEGGAAACLERLFHQRDEEEAKGREEASGFLRLLDQGTECLLAGVFEAVEDIVTDPCGRCGPCRRDGILPPDWECHLGGDAVWRGSSGEQPVPRVAVASQAQWDQVEDWIGFLKEQGIRQVIAPQGMAERVASAWQKASDEAGWVLEWEAVLSQDAPWTPLAVPTALLLPDPWGEVTRHWAWGHGWWKRGGPLRWWIVRAGLRVEGRRFEDVATNRPPIDLPSRRM